MRQLLLLLPFAACATAPLNIPAIIDASPCAAHRFDDRGRAPRAFLIGMATMYAKNCREASDQLGPADKDALKAYGLKGTIEDTYTLLIGLGMRESSGKHCEGRDMSADNVSSTTAEAGLFQASANSLAADARLKQLFEYYKKNPSQCRLSAFQPATCKASDAETYGSGTGAEFQKLSKSCPAFAVEHSALLVRRLMRHYGPLRRKEVEIVPACRAMLQSVCH